MSRELIIMTNYTRLTKTGYRLNKSGKVIDGVEPNAITSITFLGYTFKKEGIYYYLNRKQSSTFIYLQD